MGASTQIAVFTFAYAANAAKRNTIGSVFADNLMNSVAHCGELSINVERLLRHIYESGGMVRNVGLP